MILFASGCFAASSALDEVAVDHLLDHRVVLGDLRDRARVHEVDATVADVRDLGAARVREHRDDGGAGR